MQSHPTSALALVAACVVVLCTAPFASSLSNGLARLPPMGWSTWNTFRSHPRAAAHTGYRLPTHDLPLTHAACCVCCSLCVRCDYTESDLRGVAESLVSSGMAAAGYTSLNIDDCWEAEERTADGQLTWNVTKFPSGLKAFGDYLHSLNLSFGLYTSSGPYTCQVYPGPTTTIHSAHSTHSRPRSAGAGQSQLLTGQCGLSDVCWLG